MSGYRPSMLQAIINAILSYMDKPWKVIGIACLLIIGASVYTVYEERTRIIETLLHHSSRPRLLIKQFAEEADGLLLATGADVTVLATVDLESNQAQSISGFGRGHAIWLPNPTPRPLIHETTDPLLFVELVNGRTFCINVTAEAPLLWIEYDAGLRRICAIGVPKMIGVLTGILYIGWFEPPSAAHEYSAKLTLQSVANKIIAY